MKVHICASTCTTELSRHKCEDAVEQGSALKRLGSNYMCRHCKCTSNWEKSCLSKNMLSTSHQRQPFLLVIKSETFNDSMKKGEVLLAKIHAHDRAVYEIA
eukprot:1141205-Pelagomonas_calceolata.AAC.5